MRKVIFPSILCLILLASGCHRPSQEPTRLQNQPQSVVALSSSLADLWLLCGGSLCGTTDDAFDEHALDFPDSVALVGSVKDPSLETIISLNPDLVLLSPTLASHQTLKQMLSSYGIPSLAFELDSPSQYLDAVRTCIELTGDPLGYQNKALALQDSIQGILGHYSATRFNKVLLLRAHSTKLKALNQESLVGRMLLDFNVQTLSDRYPSLLDEVSVETLLMEDPDLILVVPMGDSSLAQACLNTLLTENPHFKNLCAVRTNRVYLLPKELFHYKPNDKWDDSYAYLANLLQ